MAEILLSLTIIGVVAAITLPSLMGNINERTWNTQRKALHARMAQAIGMMPQLNGYGKYTFDDASGLFTDDGLAESFITDGLSKVLKINNICDSEHLAECGISDNVTALNGAQAYQSAPKLLADIITPWFPRDAKGEQLNISKTAAFETQNGESILVMYNVNCSPKPEKTFSNGDKFYYDEAKDMVILNNGILCTSVSKFETSLISANGVKKLEINVMFNKYLTNLEKTIVCSIEGE